MTSSRWGSGDLLLGSEISGNPSSNKLLSVETDAPSSSLFGIYWLLPTLVEPDVSFAHILELTRGCMTWRKSWSCGSSKSTLSFKFSCRPLALAGFPTSGAVLFSPFFFEWRPHGRGRFSSPSFRATCLVNKTNIVKHRLPVSTTQNWIKNIIAKHIRKK